MKRVMVIGCPGAGKSTFSRKLQEKTGLPLYYLDMIWHRPDRTNVSREEFDERLGEITRRDQWILDGNYLRTMKVRLEASDTVFLLDYPWRCVWKGLFPASGKGGGICPGWKRSWIRNSVSGSWIFRKIRCRRSVGCWNSTVLAEK